MATLVADVGGTNARLALARDGRLDPASLRRLANDRFDSFDAVLDAYLAAGDGTPVEAMCVAVAGPVSAGRAALTNRGWHFDAARLAARTASARAVLINDLTALGHALATLAPDGLAAVWTPDDAARVPNRQALVLGLGTGVNVCAVRRLDGGAVCLEAEAGHATLPAAVAAIVVQAAGAAPDDFPSVEELFAGRGLARLHALLHGVAPVAGDRIVAAHAAGDGAATATLALFARALGAYCREIALQFLPREGLFLAGSVARGVLEAGQADAFRAGFTGGDGRFEPLVRSVPVATIRDDMAALNGCLRALVAPV
jgi:glucokinase